MLFSAFPFHLIANLVINIFPRRIWFAWKRNIHTFMCFIISKIDLTTKIKWNVKKKGKRCKKTAVFRINCDICYLFV